MNEFWAVFCFVSFAACVLYILAYLFDERREIKQSLKQTQADRMRQELQAAEDAFNQADADHVEAAIYALKSVMSKTNTDIRADKPEEERNTEYKAMKWLTDADKEKKHNVKLFWNK
jgi:succinylglutamate desuccinylase